MRTWVPTRQGPSFGPGRGERGEPCGPHVWISRYLRTGRNNGRTAAASMNRDETRKATTDVVPMRSKSTSKASMISRIQMKVAQAKVTNNSIHVARRRTAGVRVHACPTWTRV